MTSRALECLRPSARMPLERLTESGESDTLRADMLNILAERSAQPDRASISIRERRYLVELARTGAR